MTVHPTSHSTSMAFGAWLILAAGHFACAQDTAGRLEFEAASIKLHHSTGPIGAVERAGIEENPSLVRIENLPLRAVIQMAYGVRDYQFVGPEWLNAVRFDISAKPPAGYKHDQLQPLLRNLLADRFKLTVRREPRETSGYELVVAKGGTKLRESTGPREYFTVRPGLISGTQVSLRELTGALVGRLNRPVVDGTGLTAAYNVKLEWTPDQAPRPPGGGDEKAGEPEPGPTLFTALQEQLGLRLQAQKVSVDVVIVDHVERVPTEN